MSAAVNEQPDFAHGRLVASLGPYFLYYISPNYYQLLAADSQCPTAWLRHHLGDGDWYSEWSGEGDYLIEHWTR